MLNVAKEDNVALGIAIKAQRETYCVVGANVGSALVMLVSVLVGLLQFLQPLALVLRQVSIFIITRAARATATTAAAAVFSMLMMLWLLVLV